MKFRKRFVWKKVWNRRSKNEYLQAIRRFDAKEHHQYEALDSYKDYVFDYRDYINDGHNYRGQDKNEIYPY